jgi:hypothetical protein
MVTISKSLVFALSSALAIGAASLGATAETANTQVFKPIQGVMLDAGSKKVAGYYVAGDKVCNLTLMIANRPDADGNVTGASSRYSVPVAAGRTSRVYTAEGHALEASCSLTAHVMTLRPIEQTAAVGLK